MSNPVSFPKSAMNADNGTPGKRQQGQRSTVECRTRFPITKKSVTRAKSACPEALSLAARSLWRQPGWLLTSTSADLHGTVKHPLGRCPTHASSHCVLSFEAASNLGDHNAGRRRFRSFFPTFHAKMCLLPGLVPRPTTPSSWGTKYLITSKPNIFQGELQAQFCNDRTWYIVLPKIAYCLNRFVDRYSIISTPRPSTELDKVGELGVQHRSRAAMEMLRRQRGYTALASRSTLFAKAATKLSMRGACTTLRRLC
eukprot:6464151-Amphidinium_carterae.1